MDANFRSQFIKSQLYEIRREFNSRTIETTLGARTEKTASFNSEIELLNQFSENNSEEPTSTQLSWSSSNRQETNSGEKRDDAQQQKSHLTLREQSMTQKPQTKNVNKLNENWIPRRICSENIPTTSKAVSETNILI